MAGENTGINNTTNNAGLGSNAVTDNASTGVTTGVGTGTGTQNTFLNNFNLGNNAGAGEEIKNPLLTPSGFPKVEPPKPEDTTGDKEENKNPLDAIKNIIKTGGAGTGENNPLANYLPDFKMDERFSNYNDTDSGLSMADWIKTSAYKAGVQSPEEMNLYVKGITDFLEEEGFFKDEEPLDQRVQKSLLSIPKERTKGIEAIYTRAESMLEEKEMNFFIENVIANPEALKIIDKLMNNGVQYNRTLGTAGAVGTGAKSVIGGKYTIEEFRKDIRDPRYQNDPSFKQMVDQKAKDNNL